ncbi:MAG: hypothetical protein ACI4TT_01170 [Christensenellales bacterium]
MYDDFAILNEDKMNLANQEYLMHGANKIFSAKSLQPNEKENIMKKVEYLQNLIEKLKKNTNNEDTLLVLDDLSQSVANQKDKINVLFSEAMALAKEVEPNTVIFCNNLKLAIQTTNEIVKMLIETKDSEQTPGEIRPQYTEIIMAFLDINNKLVSLFGECRYRVFGKRKLF